MKRTDVCLGCGKKLAGKASLAMVDHSAGDVLGVFHKECMESLLKRAPLEEAARICKNTRDSLGIMY